MTGDDEGGAATVVRITLCGTRVAQRGEVRAYSLEVRAYSFLKEGGVVGVELTGEPKRSLPTDPWPPTVLVGGRFWSFDREHAWDDSPRHVEATYVPLETYEGPALPALPREFVGGVDVRVEEGEELPEEVAFAGIIYGLELRRRVPGGWVGEYC